ncbi:MAG: DUF2155 domain-containing protein [Xanthobacteraceae bacterium]
MMREPHRGPGFMLRIALSAVLGGTLVAGIAHAQPSSFYGDTPPRPPASVPNGSLPPQPPPVQYPAQQPAPPPGVGPAPSGIQAQPLPPPPGAPPSAPGAQRARIAPPAAGTVPAPANPPPPQPADTSPQPDDAVITEMPTQKIENTRAVFAGLDKITGRTISFDAAIGETVQFGALRVTARVCYTRPPTEATNTDAFVEVDEVTLQGEIKRIFNGWMFAASPGLHGVEHPIYDVWLTDCAAPTRVAEPVVQPTPAAAAPSPARQPTSKPKPAPRVQPVPPVTPAPPAQPR